MAMSGDVTKAMILTAGEGTRLRPLTLQTPKILLPIGGIPLIQYTLTWLKSHGISEVAINLHHLGNKIKGFLGDGSRFEVKISYSPEERLLGTAGGVKRMEHFFDGTFVVVYGDNLTDFDLSAMLEFHEEKKAMATLAVFEIPKAWDVGIVEMNNEGKILSLVEKPQSLVPNPQYATFANGGIYVLEEEILRYIPSQGFSDFASDIFPKLIKLDLPVYGYLLKPENYLIDIGTIDKYQKANEDMKTGRVKIKRGK